MSSKDAIELMRAYAQRGIKDWRSVKDVTKGRARKLLGNRLAEHPADAARTINAVQSGAKLVQFIPMPNVYHTGIEQCFFLPLRVDDDKTTFDLLLLCEGVNCLGFRFEPADVGDTTHGYGHIQMNQRMDNGALSVAGLPKWVPVSYPAFPLRTSEPLEMFLSMATSVHGYRKGMEGLLQNVIPEPGLRQKYAQALESALR